VLLGDGAGSFGAQTLHGRELSIRSRSRPQRRWQARSGDGEHCLLQRLGALGNGAAASSADHLRDGSSPNSVAIGDLNGDGKPDLVTANSQSNDVSVVYRAGNDAALARHGPNPPSSTPRSPSPPPSPPCPRLRHTYRHVSFFDGTRCSAPRRQRRHRRALAVAPYLGSRQISAVYNGDVGSSAASRTHQSAGSSPPRTRRSRASPTSRTTGPPGVPREPVRLRTRGRRSFATTCSARSIRRWARSRAAATPIRGHRAARRRRKPKSILVRRLRLRRLGVRLR